MWELLTRLLRFGITGGIGFCIDFGITWACKEKLKWNKYISNATGFSLAVANNYFLNRIWTFQSKDPHIIKQFFFFLAISLIGLALNTSFLYYLHERKNKHFYLSKLFAIGLVFIWNFAANSLLTFRHA
jgi:putative flippase GtrA